MNAVVVPEQPHPVADVARLPSLSPRDIDEAVRLAQMMAKGRLVPQHLQDSPADCLMVIEQAARWRMSPFAVAQSTSVIQGKLMFEGKLVNAAMNASGVLCERLSFAFSGEGEKRAVRVSGRLRGEAESRIVEVRLADVATQNSMWKKQPDQQLCYSGARVWARRHAPDVMLGVYTPEEFDEPATITASVYDQRPVENDLMPRAVVPDTGPVATTIEVPPAVAPRDTPSAAPGTAPNEKRATTAMLFILRKKAGANGVQEATIAEAFGVESLEQLPSSKINEAMRMAGGAK